MEQQLKKERKKERKKAERALRKAQRHEEKRQQEQRKEEERQRMDAARAHVDHSCVAMQRHTRGHLARASMWRRESRRWLRSHCLVRAALARPPSPTPLIEQPGPWTSSYLCDAPWGVVLKLAEQAPWALLWEHHTVSHLPVLARFFWGVGGFSDS